MKQQKKIFLWLEGMFAGKGKVKNLPVNDFKLVFAPNPNKVTIKWEEKQILFDTSFSTDEIVIRNWIKKHSI